jgi:hypothetical protein
MEKIEVQRKMETHEERYEFVGEDVTGKKSDEALVVDVVLDSSDMPLPKGQQGLLIMGADEGMDSKGNELGHQPRTWIPFKDEDNLKLAQMGLELIEQALYQEEIL